MLDSIEKRVRKDIRINNPFSKKERVLVIDDSSKESFLIIYLLKKITKGLELDIDIQKQKDVSALKTARYDKIVIPADADDSINQLIEWIAKRKGARRENKKRVSILRMILDKEVSEAAAKLGYKSHKTANMLDMLEARYPGSKFATLKSIDFLKSI